MFVQQFEIDDRSKPAILFRDDKEAGIEAGGRRDFFYSPLLQHRRHLLVDDLNVGRVAEGGVRERGRMGKRRRTNERQAISLQNLSDERGRLKSRLPNVGELEKSSPHTRQRRGRRKKESFLRLFLAALPASR